MFPISNNAALSLPSTDEDVRVFTHEVLGTDVAIEFILYLHHPVERRALGETLLGGKAWLRRRLKDHGDDWLAADDDPYISAVAGRCYVRIDGDKAPNGRSRLTYKTLLRVYEGYWNALYLARNEFEGSMRITVANQLAGYGVVRVKDPTITTAVKDHEGTSVRGSIKY